MSMIPCAHLRAYLDGEMSRLGRWRMRGHLRRCRACSERKAAEELAARRVREEFLVDTREEAEALERVAARWQRVFSAAETAPVRPRPRTRRWFAASAVVGAGAAALVLGAVTAPRRAIGDVAQSMARVRRFHLRMELPGLPARYEAWGERGVGARVEEKEDNRLTMVAVDDGRRLQSYYPEEGRVDRSDTRLGVLFRQAAGFIAGRMLLQSARGRLFAGQDWLGEAAAREVSRIRRHGRYQRRIHVDLRGGFFERMVVYAELPGDRLTQANLYTDSRSPDERPFARVFFDYPERLDPALFHLAVPPGTRSGAGDPVSDLR